MNLLKGKSLLVFPHESCLWVGSMLMKSVFMVRISIILNKNHHSLLNISRRFKINLSKIWHMICWKHWWHTPDSGEIINIYPTFSYLSFHQSSIFHTLILSSFLSSVSFHLFSFFTSIVLSLFFFPPFWSASSFSLH